MNINSVTIEDTFAEAFNMWCARIIVTGTDNYWVDVAVRQATGYGTSIIGCDAEAGLEITLPKSQTPDGRPGAAILIFAQNTKLLTQAVVNRTSQCLATCPTISIFDGLPEITNNSDTQLRFELGTPIARFGDGYQRKIDQHGRVMWAIPVTEGDMFIENSVGAIKAIGGGNIYLCGKDSSNTLTAAIKAVEALTPMQGIITPFPGGVVRCASKAGSRYEKQIASTNEKYCPTLRDNVDSKLDEDVSCVYEIIIDGVNYEAIEKAMQKAIVAACEENHGLMSISAGNFNGRLGKHHFSLHSILADIVD